MSKKKETENKKTTTRTDAKTDMPSAAPSMIDTMMKNREQEQQGEIDRMNQAVFGNIDPETAMAALNLMGPGTQQQAQQTIPEAQPIEGPGKLKTSMAVIGSMIPFFGQPLMYPYFQAKKTQEARKESDKQLVNDALTLMDANPSAFSEIIKTPGYRDAFQRHLRLSPKEIQEIADKTRNLPISFSDALRFMEAGGEVSEKGTIPMQGGQMIQMPEGPTAKRERYRSALEREYAERGLSAESITDLDIAFYAAQAEAGRGMHEIRGTNKGFALVDLMSGKAEDITPDSIKTSNIKVVPIYDKDDPESIIGYDFIDLDTLKYDENGNIVRRGNPLIFENAIQDLIDQYIEEQNLVRQNMTDKEKNKLQEKATKTVLERALEFIDDGIMYGGVRRMNSNKIKKAILGNGDKEGGAVTKTNKPTINTNPQNDATSSYIRGVKGY